MKITDSEIIKTGEKELIDGITADLDWGVIEAIFRKEHNMGIEEDIQYKKGDIVALNNRIAYQLEFEVKATLSILLDREGNYISVSMSGTGEDAGSIREDVPSKDHALDNSEPKNESLIDHDDIRTDKEETANRPDADLSVPEDAEDRYRDALNEIGETDQNRNLGSQNSIEDGEDPEMQISHLADQFGDIIDKVE